MSLRTIAFTALALVAFAANSVLCRIALSRATIDAATFSTIRLTAGAATLLLITVLTRKQSSVETSWISAGMLFLYAVPFSFAYTRLSTGTGALILFGCVQLTMMSAALWSGERPHPLQWLGLSLALAGLVYLVLPGLEAPSFVGAGLMALAGFSWGVYSLRGRSAADPLAQTTSNFVRTVPLVLAVSVLTLPRLHVQVNGVLLAVASGALASGLGYVVWYEALRGLTATRAAVVQLLVPILAALGGVVFLAEAVTWRLALSGVIILGGIGLALIGRERFQLKHERAVH
ncbi:MAG: DMT family transporter [Gemmatimonadaceae bacterium]